MFKLRLPVRERSCSRRLSEFGVHSGRRAAKVRLGSAAAATRPEGRDQACKSSTRRFPREKSCWHNEKIWPQWKQGTKYKEISHKAKINLDSLTDFLYERFRFVIDVATHLRPGSICPWGWTYAGRPSTRSKTRTPHHENENHSVSSENHILHRRHRCIACRIVCHHARVRQSEGGDALNQCARHGSCDGYHG